MEVKKAVIPAAGLGTRFLPATKVQPKEMLSVVDKPVIQYVIEEVAASGIEEVLIITGKGKHVIEDHFDTAFELEYALRQKNNLELLKEIEIAKSLDIHYIRQKEQKGLGDAIRCARTYIKNEPFAVLLGDTIVNSNVPCIKQLIDTYKKYRTSIIGVGKVPMEKIQRYGIIKGDSLDPNVFLIRDLVEKPKPEEAPSDIAIMGRYVLTPAIFDMIDKTKPGVNNEIQITDSLRLLLNKETIYACLFEGKRYDIGSKMDYLKTIVELALKREEFNSDFKKFLEHHLKSLQSENK